MINVLGFILFLIGSVLSSFYVKEGFNIKVLLGFIMMLCGSAAIFL